MMTRMTALTVFAAVSWGWSAPPAANDPAVVRTRKQAQMLDDLYKTAVVAITETYVNKETDVPAAKAAKVLFAAMKAKGYHEARLLDVTGEPYEASNVANDPFEKQAVEAIKSGKNYFEQITEQAGKPILRVATPVPVVMKKCTMCHPNYEKVPAGKAIGLLSYSLPIE